MELRIEPNARNKQQATAWAGRDHIADLRRERDGSRAKVILQLPPLATSAELRDMATRCNAAADALDGWGA